MRPSLLLLAVLVALTLGLRLGASDSNPQQDQDRFERDLSAQLQAAGFTTRAVPSPPLRHVEASQPGCSLRAAVEVWHGARVAAFSQLPPERGVPQIYYRGWVQDYPRLRPLVEQYLQRHLASFGFAIDYPPVMLVSADPACDLDSVNFAALRMHSTR